MIEIVNSWLTKLAKLKLNAVPEPWVHLVHFGIAFGVCLISSVLMNKYLGGAIMLLVAGGIEFWFDKHYEGQAFENNLSDFKDYTIGVLISWLM